MKTPILIAALFFSGFAIAQQKTNDTIKSQSTKEIETVMIT